MEQVFSGVISMVALAAVIQGVSEGMFSVMPFMSNLGMYEGLVKRLVVFVVALCVTFGFAIDLSNSVLFVDAVDPVIGKIFTSTIIAFGSSIIHAVGQKYK